MIDYDFFDIVGTEISVKISCGDAQKFHKCPIQSFRKEYKKDVVILMKPNNTSKSFHVRCKICGANINLISNS